MYQSPGFPVEAEGVPVPDLMLLRRLTFLVSRTSAVT
jgi:hypothetical protein